MGHGQKGPETGRKTPVVSAYALLGRRVLQESPGAEGRVVGRRLFLPLGVSVAVDRPEETHDPWDDTRCRLGQQVVGGLGVETDEYVTPVVEPDTVVDGVGETHVARDTLQGVCEPGQPLRTSGPRRSATVVASLPTAPLLSFVSVDYEGDGGTCGGSVPWCCAVALSTTLFGFWRALYVLPAQHSPTTLLYLCKVPRVCNDPSGPQSKPQKSIVFRGTPSSYSGNLSCLRLVLLYNQTYWPT